MLMALALKFMLLSTVSATATVARHDCQALLANTARQNFTRPSDPLAVPVQISEGSIFVGQYIEMRRLDGAPVKGEIVILSFSSVKGAILTVKVAGLDRLVELDTKSIEPHSLTAYIRDPRWLNLNKSLLHPSRRGAVVLKDRSRFRRGEIIVGVDERAEVRVGEVFIVEDTRVGIFLMQQSGEVGPLIWVNQETANRIVLDFNLAQKLHLLSVTPNEDLVINPASSQAVPVHLSIEQLKANHYVSFIDEQGHYIEGIVQSFDWESRIVNLLRWEHSNQSLTSHEETHQIKKPETLVMYMAAAPASRIASWLHHASGHVSQERIGFEKVRPQDYVSFKVVQRSRTIQLSAVVKQKFIDGIEVEPFSADGRFHPHLFLRKEQVESLYRLHVPL